MAKVIIGGEEIEIPVLNFKTIKTIWPMVEGIEGDDDMSKLMDASSDILEAVLRRSNKPLTKDEIEDRLLGPEIPGMQESLMDMLVESGLLQRKEDGSAVTGEAPGAAPSTETGTASSQNLSPPDAPAPIGSE